MKILLIVAVLALGCEMRPPKPRPKVKIIELYKVHVYHPSRCKEDQNQCPQTWYTEYEMPDGRRGSCYGVRGEPGDIIVQPRR